MQSCTLNIEYFYTVTKDKMKGNECLEEGFRPGVADHTG